jgi:glucuronide carrier protein
MAAYAIGLGGYIAGSRVQPEGALDAIRYAAGYVPAVFVLIAIVIMYFYPLTEARFTQIVAETVERRNQRVAQEG